VAVMAVVVVMAMSGCGMRHGHGKTPIR
jgi:hypothetical protein